MSNWIKIVISQQQGFIQPHHSHVRATLMTRPRNNNNKANIYTKTIEWLYSWDPSESGNPKRSKLRIWASFCWSLYTTKLSMSHFLIKPLSHITHPLFIYFPHYSSNFPTWVIDLFMRVTSFPNGCPYLLDTPFLSSHMTLLMTQPCHRTIELTRVNNRTIGEEQ